MEKLPVCESFYPHSMRKFCKSCRNAREDHPVNEEDVLDILKAVKALTDYPPDPPHHDVYAWTPPLCPPNLIDKYFENFPENKVPKLLSDGRKERLRQLLIQIPLTDISAENCRFVDDEAIPDHELFIQNMQERVLQVGIVKTWEKGMPMQCPTCLVVIEPDELIVMTSRKGSAVYHPTCFVCRNCTEYLVDLIHCTETDGRIYCVRHYSERIKKRCHACDELIFSTRYAQAAEQFYHRDHLLCFSCDEVLQTNKGYEKGGELYCSNCYESMFSYDCIKCEDRIGLENRHVTFEGKYWHYDCFTCKKCEKLLSEELFEVYEDNFYCIDCYNKSFAPRCAGCHEVFEKNNKVVKYEGDIYHVPCFKCADCEDSIGTGSFIPHDGFVYCKPCHLRNFGVRCFKCRYAITDDRGIMYNKQPYHEDCFICCKCSVHIANKPFKNIEGLWYCMNCYGDTFCKRCHSCGEPILLGADDDIMYTYEGFQWHANCFICMRCHGSLADTPFVMRDKQMICKGCTRKSSEAELTTGTANLESRKSSVSEKK